MSIHECEYYAQCIGYEMKYYVISLSLSLSPSLSPSLSLSLSPSLPHFHHCVCTCM